MATYYERFVRGIPISAVPQELVCLIAGCIRRMNIITMPTHVEAALNEQFGGSDKPRISLGGCSNQFK